ncbi:ester cyclase [Phytoactinopolyspora limicola]|uniref:ester cyclase n=1 Tax=Phytoactinopolyspora limicola TaxID=2715536 RepID=UPI00140B903D|nr:ester cyclase [Phytoactinopolyspora limicola]
MMRRAAQRTDRHAFVERFVDDIWNHRRFERLPQYLHPDYRQVDERSEVIIRGYDEFARAVRSMLELIEHARMRATHVVSSGADLAYRWELVGWVTDAEVLGPALRIMADQVPELRLISVSGTNIARMVDGLILDEVNELDQQSVVQQMGWWQ